MSDLLTHWAVFDDSRRLARHDQAIAPLFRDLIERERQHARLGAITRGGHRMIPEILQRARAAWAQSDDRLLIERKVAFALGLLTHAACDLYMKPLMRRLTRQPDGQVSKEVHREVYAYQDVYVFRQVYLSGHEEPFNRFLLAHNATSPGQALEEFVRALFQRALLSSHTFAPDLNDVDRWLEALFNLVQPLYVDVERLVRIFEQPDPAKMQAYEIETTFYRAGDPIIVAARALQRAEPVGADQLQAALPEAANQSHYGKALALSIELLRSASTFWRGEVDRITLPE